MTKVNIYLKCRVCDGSVILEVNEKDLDAYQSGEVWYVQDAFPYLSAGEREMLISGTCDPCFTLMFPGDEEE